MPKEQPSGVETPTPGIFSGLNTGAVEEDTGNGSFWEKFDTGAVETQAPQTELSFLQRLNTGAVEVSTQQAARPHVEVRQLNEGAPVTQTEPSFLRRLNTGAPEQEPAKKPKKSIIPPEVVPTLIAAGTAIGKAALKGTKTAAAWAIRTGSKALKPKERPVAHASKSTPVEQPTTPVVAETASPANQVDPDTNIEYEFYEEIPPKRGLFGRKT